MALPKFEALLAAPATWGGQVDALGNLFVAAGDYYLSSVAPGGAALRAEWQADLAAQVAATVVTLDPATGKLTITWGSGTHTFTFASTTFRDALGFAATTLTPAAASFTAPNPVPSLWRPNVPVSGQEGSFAARGRREDESRTARALSGKIWGVSFEAYTVEHFEFAGLPKAIVWDEEASGNAAESFWSSFLRTRRAFRYYQDRDDDASYLTPGGARRDYVFASEGFAPSRLRSNYDGSWRWAFDANLLV